MSNQSSKGIYCLGSALVDYEFEVKQEQLEVLGITKGQMTLADTATFEQAFTSLNQDLKYQREGGGSAMNSLITYARLGGHGGTHCIVGKDESGEFFLQELRDLNLDITAAEHSLDEATGRCLALISPDKDRTMMTNLGINEQLQLKEGEAATNLYGFQVIYSESYMLASDKPRATLLTYLDAARQSDIFICLSLSDVSMVTYCREHLEKALDGRVDILFGNYEEYKNYTGKEELEDIFAFFPANIKCLVLTRGEQGATILKRQADSKEADQLISLPAAKAQVVDTLGAGDTYAGAFLYAIYERGFSYEVAAKFASQAAGKVISHLGPRLSAAECQDLKPLLDDNN
ncbi:MAG: adenosine kinase [Candidatus Portiera sp.]|nr:adenosine kinase [Portiera sp.]